MERRRHRRRVAAVIWLLVGLLMAGCARGGTAPPDAVTVLGAVRDAMQNSGQPLPDGRIYHRACDPAGPDYLGDTLLAALLGDPVRELLTAAEGGAATSDTTAVDATPPAAINDAALFLSTAPHPGEIMILRCSDARGTATAAGLCRARLAAIRHAWQGTDYATLTDRAVVAVEGSYVILVVAEDPPRALKDARRLIP